MTEVTIDNNLFRRVLGRYPTGVTVVTACDGKDLVAMVIGSFVSVSLDPPLVGFLPGKSSTTWPKIASAGSFCVNVLGDDQLELSNSFFRKDIDPWVDIDWQERATGAPAIAGCIAWVDCTIQEVVEAGDHFLVLGRVQHIDCPDESAEPLVFFGGSYGTFRAF